MTVKDLIFRLMTFEMDEQVAIMAPDAYDSDECVRFRVGPVLQMFSHPKVFDGTFFDKHGFDGALDDYVREILDECDEELSQEECDKRYDELYDLLDSERESCIVIEVE